MSACGLAYYSLNLYFKLYASPDIIVKISQKFTNQVPFPAITICTPLFAKNNLANFHDFSTDVKNIDRKFPNLTIEEQNYLSSNVHACSPTAGTNVHRYTVNRTEHDIVKLLNKSSLSVSEALIQCGYKGIINNCSRIFNRVLTNKGYCYTFNLQGFNTIFNRDVISTDFECYKRTTIAKSMYRHNELSNETVNDDFVNIPEWSLDYGYVENLEFDSVPVRAQKGMIIAVNVYLSKKDILNLCSIAGNVFSYYFHLPNEMMMWNSHQEHYVEFGRRKDVIVSAKSYKIDEGMNKFPPKIRGCYFQGEKSLKFFKTYTKSLCEFECMTNYTLSKCGCVKFSMPRTLNTSVCNVTNANCYVKAMNAWPQYETVQDKFDATCGCLKTCNDLKYEVKFEKISALENVSILFDAKNISKESAVSRITFSIDEFEIMEYEEYAPYNLYNFVADVGGMLGLFLGCSILSLIEIVYFLNDFLIRMIKFRLSRKQIKNLSKTTAEINHPVKWLNYEKSNSHNASKNFYLP